MVILIWRLINSGMNLTIFKTGKFLNCWLLLCLFTLLTIFHIQRTEPFKISWYKLIDCLAGNSAKWHSKYSRHYTKVFDYVACCTTLKVTGIGAAECGWSNCKEIKSGKWSLISTSNLKKQVTLYTTSSLRQAQIKQKEYEKLECNNKYTRWGDEDENLIPT